MWTEEKLDQLLTEPSQALIEDMKHIKGDIMVLGAGGKMGPTLCILAKNAIKKAGIDKRVIAVSRFTDPIAAWKPSAATFWIRKSCALCRRLKISSIWREENSAPTVQSGRRGQ